MGDADSCARDRKPGVYHCAGPVRSQDPEDLAAPDLEADVVDRREVAELAQQVLHLHHRLGAVLGDRAGERGGRDGSEFREAQQRVGRPFAAGRHRKHDVAVERRVHRMDRAPEAGLRHHGDTLELRLGERGVDGQPVFFGEIRNDGLTVANRRAVIDDIGKLPARGRRRIENVFVGEGQPGQRPIGDIDVLVLGEPDRDQLYVALSTAEQRLARPVQATIRDRDWL